MVKYSPFRYRTLPSTIVSSTSLPEAEYTRLLGQIMDRMHVGLRQIQHDEVRFEAYGQLSTVIPSLAFGSRVSGGSQSLGRRDQCGIKLFSFVRYGENLHFFYHI